MEKSQDVMALAAQLGKFEGMKAQLPPVNDWNPALSGDMDMIIKKDGSWVHEGDAIKREKLIRTFSTILKREGGDYYLLTPVEKWRIQVEDMPFLVVLANIVNEGEGQTITLMTNVGDEVTLGTKQCLKLSSDSRPYVEIRHGLNARLNRNVYYQLAELAQEGLSGQFEFQSGGKSQQIG
ncbi:hypothetical protein A9Q73_08585 [Bermanella sp. 47_1433_sub80_T6]|nr:hypothetical protein A9Q73_08585 [Bermanella sp. 47_1433_sub80_T6]